MKIGVTLPLGNHPSQENKQIRSGFHAPVLDSARVTGVDDRTGSIEVGKDADLILLDGNPLEDISAILRATLVMKGNTVYRPDELYKAIGVRPFVNSTEI